MEKNFKFIDLFCGVGGFHQAMKSLGGECVFASDIDKHCQETYYNNYGLKPVGDITKVDASEIEPFDVLCAGFPCQAFSLAGKRLGFEDPTKGTLFFDVMRIARHHKPKFMLLENVKNLATHDDGNTWKTIYQSITEAGYYTLKEPVVFSPHYIGIPQNRERVFIMCIRKDIGNLPDFVFDKENIPVCNFNDVLQDDSEIENIEHFRIDDKHEALLNHYDALMKGVKGDMPGCPFRCDHFNELDKTDDLSRYPEWIRPVIRKCNAYYMKHKDFLDKWLEDGKSVEMFCGSRMWMEWQTERSENPNIWDNLIQFRPSRIRVKRLTYFPALVAIVQTSIVGPRKRYLTPRECARLQSFPDDFKLCENEHQAYKQFGNSVNVEVVKLFAKFLFGDEETRKKYTKNTLF